MLDRTWSAIKTKAKHLNLKRKKRGNLANLLAEMPEAYYWIGFLFADGYIDFKRYEIGLSISKYDKQHLEKFCNFIEINPNEIISRKQSVNLNCLKPIIGKGQVSITARDINIVSKLIKKFDFKPSKKYNPPQTINIHNPNLFLSFLIGFIDGDGSINKRYNNSTIKIELHASWLHILDDLDKRVKEICNTDCKTKARINTNGYAFVAWHGYQINQTLKRVAKELKLPILNRKWNFVDEVCTTKTEISIERKAKVLEMYCEGFKPFQISKLTGYTYSCVHHICSRYGNPH